MFPALLFTLILASANAMDIMEGLQQLASLRKMLGGDINIDWWFPLFKWPSLIGQMKITQPCDLNCLEFDALLTPICRWRNEWTICGPGDELEFIRMHGSWGNEQGQTIFGTDERPDGFFLFAGSQKKMHADHSAMLVSDPIQCQEGDGWLKFRYWTSPGTAVRVCVRKPSAGKIYEWCSRDVLSGDPGPALFNIPGSILYTFELVIEARRFTLDAFGVQGGAVAIDDIYYNASRIYECAMIPHFDPLSELLPPTCHALTCTFDRGKCLDSIAGSGWRVTEEPIGSRHLGVRSKLEGPYAYARGPGSSSLMLKAFDLPRRAVVEFCYYSAAFGARLVVYITRKKKEEREEVFRSPEIDLSPHQWICERVHLEEGAYKSMEFSAERLPSFSYLALDQIGFVDPLRGGDMCEYARSVEGRGVEGAEGGAGGGAGEKKTEPVPISKDSMLGGGLGAGEMKKSSSGDSVVFGGGLGAVPGESGAAEEKNKSGVFSGLGAEGEKGGGEGAGGAGAGGEVSMGGSDPSVFGGGFARMSSKNATFHMIRSWFR